MIDVLPHMNPARARVNGIELVYEVFGDSGSPPMVLIMGLGAQMIDWKDAFCRLLADRGFRVIRFDNRDAGQSSVLEDLGHPDIGEMVAAAGRGERLHAPYLLRDLVADTIGLFDILEIDAAHVVGLSMGGMVGQLLAAAHRDRVLTLTSIMSHTAEPGLPGPTPEAWSCLTAPLATTLDDFIEQYLFKWRVYAGPRYPLDVDAAREHAARLFARGVHTAGRDRQLAAILASGSRKEAVASVTCPVLVVHGDADPVVPIEGGRATARAAKHSRILEIEGMGHDLAKGTWPQVVDAIANHASGRRS